MSERNSRFVLVCQQAFACAVVAAVGVSAVGVVELEIIAPDRGTPVQALGSSSVALVSSAPVKATVRTVPLGGRGTGLNTLPGKSGTPTDGSQEIRVVSEPEPVSGFATVGVTWEDGQQLSEDEVVVELRTLDDGTWSEWQEMHFDPAHQPDPGGEGTEVREGTDAVVVGDVDEVQVRAVSESGVSPGGLALAMVDPGEDDELLEVQSSGTTPATTYSDGDAVFAGSPVTGRTAGAMEVAPKPRILSRKAWGADEGLRDPGSLRYGDIQAAFVHHTVNANDYSRAQVPSILRGIYAYHTQSRGWSDVGYNFLVDRFGQIWEGRYGGVDRPVIGAHTLGYNEETFAMSAIGNFDIARPSAAMIRAYGQLFAWKLSLHGIAADDPRRLVDDRYLPAINGHRDADSTACPGRYLYAELGEIRKQAAAIQRGGGSNPPPEEPEPPQQLAPGAPLNADLSGEAWPDLVVRDATTGQAVVVRTRGQLAFGPGRTAAERWQDVDLVAAAGDLDGDGVGDLVTRSSGTGSTILQRGSTDGSFRGVPTGYKRLARLDQLTGVGDADGDGHDDLVGRRTTDFALMLYPGKGNGSLARPVKLAADWRRYDLTQGVDDFDGDGVVDLVARDGTTLYLVPVDATGAGTPVALRGDWSGFDLVAGRGDATGDGTPDLVARESRTGTTYIYPGDGNGGWDPRVGGWQAYAGTSWLAMAGRLSDGRWPALVGLNTETGRLRVFPHTGRQNLGSSMDTGTVLEGDDVLLSVGDWDGDGRGDIMTRDASSGEMRLRRGERGNTFAAPVVAGQGWDEVRMVAAVGDVTGDGNPDLMGRAADGSDRVYPGDGTAGFKASFVAREPAKGHSQVSLGLWDGDKIPDTAVRRGDGTLWLWSSERSSSIRLAEQLRRYDWLRGLGDLDGNGRADLVVRLRDSGRIFLLPGRRDGFGPRRLIAPGFEGFDLVG